MFVLKAMKNKWGSADQRNAVYYAKGKLGDDKYKYSQSYKTNIIAFVADVILHWGEVAGIF